MSNGERRLICSVMKMLRGAKQSEIREVARAAVKWERGIGCFIKVRLMNSFRSGTKPRRRCVVDSGWVRIEGKPGPEAPGTGRRDAYPTPCPSNGRSQAAARGEGAQLTLSERRHSAGLHRLHHSERTPSSWAHHPASRITPRIHRPGGWKLLDKTSPSGYEMMKTSYLYAECTPFSAEELPSAAGALRCGGLAGRCRRSDKGRG